jgi:hypothetical protein
MTFTEIQTEILDRLNLTSTAASTRVGRAINRVYREVGTSIGMSFMRQTNTNKTVSIANPEVTFTATEKVLQVWIIDGDENPTILQEVQLAELKERVAPSSDSPKRWALARTASNSVTIRLDAAPATAYSLYADVIAEVTDLSGSTEPAFPESFHDIIVEGVLKDEYRKLEKAQLAKYSEETFQKRLSDLRMFVAKSNYQLIRQGEHTISSNQQRTSGGGSGGSVSFPATSITITGAWTFDRDPLAPFSVSSGSAVVTNLDADKLDGKDESAFAEIAASETISGTWTFSTKPNINAGLQFPATQAVSTDANTLDDYEEGTWTPVLGGVTTTSGQTYGTQAGYYQKIGRWVHASGIVTLTAKGSNTGQIVIKGLPFAPDINSGSVSIGYWGNLTTPVSHLAGFTQASQTYALLYYATGDDASLSALAAGDISDTTDLRFSVSYRTAS